MSICLPHNRAEPGQALYEADVARRPRYHDGAPRKRWHQLGEVEKWSWDRPVVPTPTTAAHGAT